MARRRIDDYDAELVREAWQRQRSEGKATHVTFLALARLFQERTGRAINTALGCLKRRREKRLEDLSPAVIQNALDTLGSDTSKRAAHSQIQAILEWGRRRGAVAVNAARGVIPPPKPKTDGLTLVSRGDVASRLEIFRAMLPTRLYRALEHYVTGGPLSLTPQDRKVLLRELAKAERVAGLTKLTPRELRYGYSAGR